MAAGPTIRMLTLNLSAIEHPCVRVAAIVVSEINERLSPKNDPPTMMAVRNGVDAVNPDAPESAISFAIPAAIGTSATIVPTLVPIDMEMKQEAMKSPAYRSLPGRSRIARFTVASIAPISFAVLANAPAITNIHIIRRTFLLPAPCEKMETFSSNELPLLMISA